MLRKTPFLVFSFCCISAQAYALPLEVYINGSFSGFDEGTTFGIGDAHIDAMADVLSWNVTTHVSTGYTDGFVTSTSWWSIWDNYGESTVTSCTDNGGLMDLCTNTSFSTQPLVGFSITSPINQLLTITAYQEVSEEVIPEGYITETTNYVFYHIDPAFVPIPATAWLFGSALIGLAGIKRNK